MPKIGILAYGSLIDEPGDEIGPLVVKQIKGVETPFSIEFARTSQTRAGAPTLVPVRTGGSPVKATVLVLAEDVFLEHARDILWRRETGRVGSSQRYHAPAEPTENTVLVDEFAHLAGMNTVISTRIGVNITEPNPELLADLAIRSAKTDAGAKRRDGISYLMDAKKNGLSTPLSPGYETEILRIMGAASLEGAWAMCQKEGA